MFACIHAPDAGAIAASFSPFVERIDERTAVFSITLRQAPSLPAEACAKAGPPPAQTAIAATIEAAILAARHFPGHTVISPGEEARTLGPLPLSVLHPDPELFETFSLWGIHTLADLARLPEDDLAVRLGPRGTHLQRLARGALERPLRPHLTPTPYEESAELDHPLKLREPLMFLAARFLHDIAARLRSQSLAAAAIRLTLNREERTLALPFPTRDAKLLLKLIEHSLERQPPAEPVERVHLELMPTQPRRLQHGLFLPAAPEPEKLELTLGKIRALVGEPNAGYPELFDTHRPNAGHPNALGLSPLAFRHFRPPLAAQVALDAGYPKHLHTKRFRGRIVQLAGPWRTSGDWWQPDTWDRDEFDLALDDGALYRIYKDRPSEQWFVEGIYD